MYKDSKELQSIDQSTISALIAYDPAHKEMLQVIQDNMPEVQRATSFFGKSQSQFMDNMLTVSHTTPLRNLRQILAEIEKKKSALREAYFKTQKKDVEIRMKQRELDKETDDLKQEMLYIEIQELRTQAAESGLYISGAVRALANYLSQYNSILEKMGKTEFNEIDFEKEEEKYHIQKAFEQGLTAARSRGMVIDEGNMIYFTQIGINGAMAQAEVRGYLILEQEMIQKGLYPTHKDFLDFLEAMSKKYSGSAKAYAEAKGMTGEITKVAALQEGDKRLLLRQNTNES